MIVFQSILSLSLLQKGELHHKVTKGFFVHFDRILCDLGVFAVLRYVFLHRLRRKLLPITKTSLNAMDAAAKMGLRKPAAAAGMRMML